MHYSRWKRRGDPLGGPSRRLPGVAANPCKVEGCPNLARNQGLCGRHYARFKRHGDPHFDPVLTPEERFWSKVEKTGLTEDACWIYTGALVRGYGVFSVSNRNVSAHRWAYTHCIGPIPEGMTLDHLCYTRNCVRPSHLEPVSNSENVKRSHGRVHYVVLFKLR